MASRASYEIVLIIIIILVFSPVSALLETDAANSTESFSAGSSTDPYSITLFIPTSSQIHSDQITDQINSPDRDVLIATTFGLSTFNGTWSTRHINRDNISQGLMDDFITAIEFDHEGNLWLGYSGGIQIFNGIYYQVIRDQQLLKDPRIHDLQRWNNDMWVSTGHSGIQRYRNGEWTWYQPMAQNGPGFFEIDSMALDSASNSLVIATENEGLWIIRSQNDPVMFEELAAKDDAAGQMQHVKRDPLGGVYFFNPEKIIHFDTGSGFKDILTIRDLTQKQITINDIAAGSDGNLYLATDDGMYIWRDGGVFHHLSRFEGIGASEIVRTVNVDADNRVWFSTQGYVGYYKENVNPEQLQINLVTPAPSLIPVVIIHETLIIPTTTTPQISSSTSDSSPVMTMISRITDPITCAIQTLMQKIGVNYGS